MKISEKLSDLKRSESELQRLYTQREGVARLSFKSTILNLDKLSDEEINAKKKVFYDDQIKKIKEIETNIESLKQSIIDGRNDVNKKNIELGVDKKLIEFKHIKIELSKLMSLVKSNHMFSSYEVDINIFEELKVNDKIKALEKRKAKIDSEIQQINWNTDL